ncbi:hypothetical protein TL16_g09681 [Triparma laevis f. inornata]|uniref:EF-hand domain-containing protein n=1 Tax=Triparma laevis f. inornata TaxID=1714386 RepID=A0A9W7BBD1_9STRA|nr:hypothetical protein TL16_g09681 [Triparma laevis f. inornata]
MNRLEVTEKEATQFFKLFEKIDGDHSGSIEIEEFFMYFKIEPTEFAQRAFGIMDFEGGKVSSEKDLLEEKKKKEKLSKMGANRKKKAKVKTLEEQMEEGKNKFREGDGSLSYGEFFISLWNFCTLTHETLVKFAFDLYDLDGSGELSIDEVYEMVRTIHPNRDSRHSKKEAKKLMDIMDKDESDGVITFKEFVAAHKKLGTVIFPAFMLQRQIRLKAMTKRFWGKATKKREKEFGADGTANDLIELYQKLCEEKVEYEVNEVEIEDEEENDEAEQKRLLAELEELRKAKDEERKNWAKSQSLEFMDGEDAPSANGLLIAMASKRLQAKIYHEPREGSWWAENPDVKGPRPPGQRPCSAKFKNERNFIHEDEPQVIIDRGVADLMASVDKARIRGKRGVNRARRTVQSARAVRKDVDAENNWKPHVPYSLHMLVKHPLRLAGIHTPKVFHTKEIADAMTDNQRRVVTYMGSNAKRLKSPPRRVYKGSDDGSKKVNVTAEEEVDIS